MLSRSTDTSFFCWVFAVNFILFNFHFVVKLQYAIQTV